MPTDGGPGPSRSSQAVAALRATFERPSTPDGDPTAQARLCAGMPPARAVWLVGHLAARTRFFDGQVLAALDRGTPQVVIVGAGYDDRALRFAAPGVRFFEVDQAGTQADKRRRLSALGVDAAAVTLVAADLRTDDVGQVLDGHGHRADRPTLWLCEGLLVYLDQATIVEALSALSGRSVPGSRLAASLAVRAAGGELAAAVDAANARRPNGVAEPWRTVLTPADHLDLLARAGWRVDQQVDDAELEPTARAGRSLLVGARPELR